MQHYLNAFKNFADFNGRATRQEYWMFVIFNVLFSILAAIIDFVIFRTPISLLYLLYALVSIIPSLSIGVRRLHDSGRSGFMLLIGLIPFIGGIWLLVLLLAPSEEEDSAYGEYKSNALDAPMETEAITNKKADNAILLFVSWILLSTILWKVIPFIISIDFNSPTYLIILILQTIIGALLTINMALAVKEGTKRTAALVIAILILLFDLYHCYNLYSQILRMDF